MPRKTAVDLTPRVIRAHNNVPKQTLVVRPLFYPKTILRNPINFYSRRCDVQSIRVKYMCTSCPTILHSLRVIFVALNFLHGIVLVKKIITEQKQRYTRRISRMEFRNSYRLYLNTVELAKNIFIL